MKLSIITINYNDHAGLMRTIASVTPVLASDVEHVIVDGDSSDGSKELLTTHDHPKRISVSEPDQGIYNAMNKGVTMASGEYLLFINAGDTLLERSAISKAIPALDGAVDYVIGDLMVQDEEGNDSLWQLPEELTANVLLTRSVPHPATFIKRQQLVKRPYDETLKIVADWKHFLTGLLKHNCTYTRISVAVSRFYMDGISAAVDQQANRHAEMEQVKDVEFSMFKLDPYDAYLWKNYASRNKRVDYLRRIDSSPILRKLATGILYCLAQFTTRR